MWSWLDVFIVASSLWEVVVDIVALVLEGQGRSCWRISLWNFAIFPEYRRRVWMIYLWWKMENGQMNKGKCLGKYAHPNRRIWKIPSGISCLEIDFFSQKVGADSSVWSFKLSFLWVSNFVDFIGGWWLLQDCLWKHNSNSASNLTRSQHFLSKLISWWCYTLGPKKPVLSPRSLGFHDPIWTIFFLDASPPPTRLDKEVTINQGQQTLPTPLWHSLT